MSVTLIIIIVTVIVSIAAFSNEQIKDKLIFYPPAISQQKEWYRFLTHGFIHANLAHLAFNMYAFYSFGSFLESAFMQIFGNSGRLLYLIMYVSAIAAASAPEYMRQRNNYYHRSLGASGAVSAIIFAAIFLNPVAKVGLIFLPVAAPGFVFGLIFLVITAYLSKRGGGPIDHSAHLWGSLYGIAFLIVMCFALHTGFNPIDNFVQSIKSWLQ